MINKDYVIFSNRRWESLSDSSFRRYSCRETVWSGRISTGVFGMTNCPAGNRGPKNKHEVLLAEGNEGLLELVDLGFIPCSVCHPEEKEEGFLDFIEDKVEAKYRIKHAIDFCDKKVLPFDARRLNWPKITSMTNGAAGRIYLPRGLDQKAINHFGDDFMVETGFELPKMGFYDSNSPTRFTEYKVE